MKQVKIADITLCNGEYTFKEKLNVARYLEELRVDVIELPNLTASKTDEVLLRTLASFIRLSKLSVAVSTDDEFAAAQRILAGIEGAIIRVEVPVSTVGMEYFHQMKAPKMLAWVAKTVAAAKSKFAVEFCAKDATRADKDELLSIVAAAQDAGADLISITDELGQTMPDDFAALVRDVVAICRVPVGVRACDSEGLAVAQSVLAVKAGASFVKAGKSGVGADLETLGKLLHNAAQQYGVQINLDATILHRNARLIESVRATAEFAAPQGDSNIVLDDTDDKARVLEEVAKIGYDLNEREQDYVFEEFLRVASKKKVGAKELAAIVESVAAQVPTVYKLESYVLNNGNIIPSSAQITVAKDNAVLRGVSIGDGPIDAAFRALEQIVGAHYELDDFKINAVTEGREAVGQAQVKLRHGGKVYIGNGVSTDIIGASIRAYLSAVNKIMYEGV